MKNMVASLPVSLHSSEIFFKSALFAPAPVSDRARLEREWKDGDQNVNICTDAMYTYVCMFEFSVNVWMYVRMYVCTYICMYVCACVLILQCLTHRRLE